MDFTMIADSLHRTLRYVYLVAIAASMPGGFWYLRGHYAETVHLPDMLFFILVYLAGTAFVALYVMLTQVHFPNTIGRALLTLGLLAANGVTGITLADFDIFYGAFSVVVTNLFAICIYLVYYLALYGKTATRSELYFVMSEKNTFVFFSGLLISFALILWAFSGPVVAEILEPRPLYLKGLYIGIFAIDLVLTSRQYIVWNMLLKRHETSLQADIIEQHAIPISIAMILGILACLPIAANFSSAKPDPLVKYGREEYRSEFRRLLGGSDTWQPAIFTGLTYGMSCTEVARRFSISCPGKRSRHWSTDFDKERYRTVRELEFTIYGRLGVTSARILFKRTGNQRLLAETLWAVANEKWGAPDVRKQKAKQGVARYTKEPDVIWSRGGKRIEIDYERDAYVLTEKL